MKLKHKLERLSMPASLGHGPAPAAMMDPSVVSSAPSSPPEHAHGASEAIDTKLAKLSSLRRQLEAIRSAGTTRPAPPAPWRAPDAELERPSGGLPGERAQTPHGPLRRVVTVYEADHRHGSAELAFARCALGSEVSMLALDPAFEALDFARALYIDTETTGLSGGAGTLPFLIGMAGFDGEAFEVEQLLLERPGLEAPMLRRLAERLAGASTIVSYNGKSFDWPLLRTRFVLNRLVPPKLPSHLDLLHCARRVYKARLGSVRLVYLEQELLGFERIDDLPGALIPERYLAFLRGRAAGATLAPILEHNRSDLVALPALLGELLRRFCGAHARQDARDQLGFAHVAARAAAPARAIALAHAAVESDTRGELAGRALCLVGELELRAGALAGAIAAFERAIELSASAQDRARAHLALAKLYERHVKQPERALVHAAHTAPCEGDDACARRQARLARRLARRSP